MTPTVLALFAHPDDEAFSCGGTLALYADRGAEVVVLCATRGESGKITDPDIAPDSDVGALREEELRASCRALGLGEPILLDYHDSGRQERTRHDDPRSLLNTDEATLERDLLVHIARLRPQIMLTFDPHGVYGHIDHLRMHRAATAAFWSAGGVAAPAPRRLFYTAMPSSLMARLQSLRRSGPLAELDPELYGVSDDSLAAIIEVTPVAERKRAAIRAHRSQVGPSSSFAGLDSGDGASVWAETFVRESFTLGGLRGAFPGGPVDDLFAGMDGAPGR